MSYKKDKQLAIGKEVYTRKITKKQAMEKYSRSGSAIEQYVTKYKISQGIPLRGASQSPTSVIPPNATDMERYQAMTKEELIDELILTKANELRAKKGYEVKGGGANKEFSILKDKNSK